MLVSIYQLMGITGCQRVPRQVHLGKGRVWWDVYQRDTLLEFDLVRLTK